MGLRLLERKFKALEEEERRIYDYYDLQKPRKNQHVWIKELRDDYTEDIKNFAFPRYNLARKFLKRQAEDFEKITKKDKTDKVLQELREDEQNDEHMGIKNDKIRKKVFRNSVVQHHVNKSIIAISQQTNTRHSLRPQSQHHSRGSEIKTETNFSVKNKTHSELYANKNILAQPSMPKKKDSININVLPDTQSGKRTIKTANSMTSDNVTRTVPKHPSFIKPDEQNHDMADLLPQSYVSPSNIYPVDDESSESSIIENNSIEKHKKNIDSFKENVINNNLKKTETKFWVRTDNVFKEGKSKYRNNSAIKKETQIEVEQLGMSKDIEKKKKINYNFTQCTINQTNTGIPENPKKKEQRENEREEMFNLRKKKMIFRKNFNDKFSRINALKKPLNSSMSGPMNFNYRSSKLSLTEEHESMDTLALYGDETNLVSFLQGNIAPIDINIKKFIFMSLYRDTHYSSKETSITNFNWMEKIPKDFCKNNSICLMVDLKTSTFVNFEFYKTDKANYLVNGKYRICALNDIIYKLFPKDTNMILIYMYSPKSNDLNQIQEHSEKKYKIIYKFVNFSNPYTYNIKDIFKFMCSFLISLAVSIQIEEQIVSQLPDDIDEFAYPSPQLKDLILKIPQLLEIVRNTVEVEFNSQDCRTIDVADMFQIVINEERNLYSDSIGFGSNTMSIINQQSADLTYKNNDINYMQNQQDIDQSLYNKNPFGDQKYRDNNYYAVNQQRPYSTGSTCNNFVFKRPNSVYCGTNPNKQSKKVGKTNIWQIRPQSGITGHQPTAQYVDNRNSVISQSIYETHNSKDNKNNFVDTTKNERSQIVCNLENSQNNVYHDKNGFRVSLPTNSRKQSLPINHISRNSVGSSSGNVNNKSSKKKFSNENSNSKYGIAAHLVNSLTGDFDGEMFLTKEHKGIPKILKNE